MATKSKPSAGDIEARKRAEIDNRIFQKQRNSPDPFPFREKKFAEESTKKLRAQQAAARGANPSKAPPVKDSSVDLGDDFSSEKKRKRK